FHERLRDPARALAGWRTVPVRARAAMTELDHWSAAVDALLRHATEDRQAIADALLDGVDPGEPVAVESTGGDPHRGGRTVLRVRFASGAVLAYKPRSLAPEVAFSTILDALADDLGRDVPTAAAVLDRGDHGWVEWVEAAPCPTVTAVERFYRRQGVLLAVLHVLGTTDLHHENLIAVGASPILVDLETLAHPVLPGWPVEGDTDASDSSGLDDSVLRIGLLPHRLLVGDDALDPSGLAADGDQRVIRGGLQVEAGGTDRMRLVEGERTLGPTPGRPMFDGRPVDVLDHVDALRAGFRAGRRAIRRHRDAWSAADGPLADLWQAPVRVVLRPTRVYALLLSEAFHPHRLGDAIERDLLFERLWAGVRRQPLLGSVIASERAELERGDVPSFTTRVDSRHLWDGMGRDLGPLLPESAADGIRRRLAALDATDDARQEELVEASFELRATEARQRPRPGSTIDKTVGGGSEPIDPSRWIDGAQRAGDALIERAFRGRHGARWLVPRRLGTDRWSLVEAGPDLYFGVSCVALFLAALAEVADEPRYGLVADEAVATIERMLTIEDPAVRRDLGLTSAGAFDGLAGVVYALLHLARWRRRSELVEQAEALVEALVDTVEQDRHHDVVSGAAGTAVVARRLAVLRPSTAADALVARCGDRLAERAETLSTGVAWRPASGGEPLAGMAHGVAGIAWALAEVGGHRELIDAALDAEDALYDPVAGNWRDLRPRPAGVDERFLVAWCHGAPGVGLARLALGLADPELDARRRTRLDRDIDRAVTTTLDGGFGLGHSLCHGDLGNLDMLLEVAVHRGDAALEDRARRLGLAVASSIERQGFLVGTPGGTRPPGAMVGLAGIGYGLLRLAAPRVVPSWLRLAPFPTAA
ncbi:MAG: type 2 lanthipeptide synthetase LanM family protein, partial [Acidobacteriota bacterium]